MMKSAGAARIQAISEGGIGLGREQDVEQRPRQLIG